MKKIFFIVLIKILTLIAINAHAQVPVPELRPAPAKLQNKLEFIIEKVLALKKQTRQSAIALLSFTLKAPLPFHNFKML